MNAENYTIVITGATSGIGKALVFQLAKQNCRIVLLGRNKDKLKNTIREVQSEFPHSGLYQFHLDLASQKSIRTTSVAIREQFPLINCLVNNAGVWTTDLERSKEGIEMQFAVNHIGHFLLTHKLLPSLQNAKQAKLITVSSESHQYGKIHFDDVNLEANYHGLKAYGQSKLANLLFMNEFERRKPNNSISTFSVSPGLVKTDIGVKHTSFIHSLAWKIRRLGGKSPAKAAEYIADYIFKDNHHLSGNYWQNGKQISASKEANDAANAKRLWVLSKELTGIDHYFNQSL